MNIYIFLAHTMGGLTGSAVYVRNKYNWLKENGWEVIVLDGTGKNNSPIIIEEFKQFKNNRIKELYFHPNSFFKWKQKLVIKRILKCIPFQGKFVIESNNPNLALWGELVAKELSAKHLIFTLGENDIVNTKEEFDFFWHKAFNKEFFCIAPKAAKHFFSKFEAIENEDDLYWSAGNSSPVEDVLCEELESIPNSDYTIGYFGRLKSYTNNVFSSIDSFAKKNSFNSINLIVFGIENGEHLSDLITQKNVSIFYIGAKTVLPKKFFDKCSLIIANAACAKIAFESGAIVVSMDVERQKPLGVLGYTTSEISFRSPQCTDERELDIIIEDVINNPNKYLVPSLSLANVNIGFESQIKYADLSKSPIFNISSCRQSNSIRSKVRKFLLSLGFVNIISYYRYSYRKK